MSNRLASETSPYLLQHADNPVDWRPWSAGVLEEARQRDRPIFLSIGYAACHWCHVMAHESFEDQAVAEILNRDFIPVKVDREELPDVDSVYMDAVVALTGQGGWPLSAFLTPDGRPFYGGTYFPPERRHGMPAFREVLAAVSGAWQGDRSRLEETARRLSEHVAAAPAAATSDDEIDPELEVRAMETLLRNYDWDHGGWGGAPKFPAAGAIGLLLQRHQRTGDRMALDIARHGLLAMAAGGIYDQLGGGFHRYAVDRSWTVPHFEKMLYDNALLARTYLEAWQVTGVARFYDVAVATLEFLRRELRTPEGGFAASLDADSEGEEGRFYVWTPAEIDSVLEDPQQRQAVTATFEMPPGGNFEGRLVLRRPFPASTEAPSDESREETLAVPLRALREARSVRERPAIDDKVIAAWNGLALSAWAAATRILRRPQDLETAQTLAAFLLNALRPEGRLNRTYRMGEARHPAYLDDHAALACGLLDLYQVDFDRTWFEACLQLTGTILDEFADPAGGFFDTSALHAPLPTRPRSLQDTPVPSGGALTAALLLRLEALTGEPRYREAALPPLLGMQSTLDRHPTAFAAWLEAAAMAASPIPQLAILGSPGDGDFAALVSQAHSAFLPRLVLAAGQPSSSPQLLAGKALQDGRATAYLCRDFVCHVPTTSPEELRRQLVEAR